MQSFPKEGYSLAYKQLVIFCFCLAAVYFSRGFFFLVMAAIGVMWAMKGKTERAFCVLLMVTFMSILNPHIIDRRFAMVTFGLRGATLVISLALIFRAISFKRRVYLPVGGLLLFLAAAAFSSAFGYNPLASYFKLLDFLILFCGIWIGARGLGRNMQDIHLFRYTLLSLSAFLVFGSIILYPFPGVSTLQGILIFRSTGEDLALLNEIMSENLLMGNISYFCGITGQSQVLAPILTCIFGWVLSDMLFVRRRLGWLHCAILVGSMPLLYLSRSRVGFVGICAAIAIVCLWLPTKTTVDAHTKKWIQRIACGIGMLIFVGVIVAELQGEFISKWVRKTNDVEGDRRDLTEAFTSSRQGLIELCMDDFKKNPLFGMGFQVSYKSQANYQSARWEGASSARDFIGSMGAVSTEKGILPLMLLGETGIIGLLAFIGFLGIFYGSCARQRLWVTMALMCVFLINNIGETTFFSGSLGMNQWLFAAVGGYVLDLILIDVSAQKTRYYGGF